MIGVRQVVCFAAVVALSSAVAQGAIDQRVEELRIRDRIPVGGPATGLAAAGDSILATVMTRRGVELLRIDPATRTVTKRVNLGRSLNLDRNFFDYRVAVGFGSIWVLENTNNVLVRLDPALTRVTKTLKLAGTIGMGLAFGSAWVAQFYDYSVARVDPRTNRVRGRVPATGPTAVASGAGSIWVLAHRASEVIRIDPSTNRVVARIPLQVAQGSPERMAFGEGSVWVTDDGGAAAGRGGVVRIDPTANRQVAEILMPPGVWGTFYVTTGAGNVWIETRSGHLARVDPRTNEVTGLADLKGSRPCPVSGGGVTICNRGVLFAEGSLWIGSWSDNSIVRIDAG